MARRPRSSTLETRTARLKLPVQRKPHCFTTLSPGIALGYRRGKDRNAWVLRASDLRGSNWIKNLPGIPDDFEEANGTTIIDFWVAQDVARRLARGTVENGRPVTVGECLRDYERDLAARGGLAGNASRVRHHLPPALASKPVSLLTARELQHWRDGLVGMAPATVNRTTRILKAALSLASRHDSRIVNGNAWKHGLASLRDAHRARNAILADGEVCALITAAYDDPAFGLLAEVGATTGARPSQLEKLEVGDLQADRSSDPRLLMPASRKGCAGKRVERRPVPIPASLAVKLRQAAAGRDAAAPLLLRDGKPWSASSADYRRPFERAVARAGLKPSTTFYALRHSSIVRQILAGTPLRVIADAHDTSTAMIERTYSRYIGDHSDWLLRAGLLDTSAPPATTNVVPLGRRS